jgi:hypothetical protein
VTKEDKDKNRKYPQAQIIIPLLHFTQEYFRDRYLYFTIGKGWLKENVMITCTYNGE